MTDIVKISTWISTGVFWQSTVRALAVVSKPQCLFIDKIKEVRNDLAFLFCKIKRFFAFQPPFCCL